MKVTLHWEYIGEGQYSCSANDVIGFGKDSSEAMNRAIALLTAASHVPRSEMTFDYQ